MTISRRTLATFLLAMMVVLSTSVVLAAEESPLQNSIFLPNEIPSAGGNSTLEMPFNIQTSTAGHANVFCLAHPNTIAPIWPNSVISAKGDTYTRSTGGNTYCLATEVEYVTASASPEGESKEQLSLLMSFGPLPAGSSYTFTLRQIECSATCRAMAGSYDVNLDVAAPTAIQLDNVNVAASGQMVLPALLLVMVVGSLGTFLVQRRREPMA
ncbi:MAG: hypothetical protein KDE28_11395 [Anaerolineales bacterium]|nr:hypothetical protein [Anaerolineales bacterium]